MKKYSKKIQNGWAFYDWANSVYPLVISSAIFPIFYSTVVPDQIIFLGFELENTVLISYVTAFSFLMVVLLLPILSGIADYMGNKKYFLQFFCYLGALGCIGLTFFDVDH